MFKFAVDEHGLYGCDEGAMKAASLELRGLSSVMRCGVAGLHLPLAAVVDYRGYQLIAQQLLPVNKGTIIYGSDNGGYTIHAGEDPQFEAKISEIARKLHLKTHRVQETGAHMRSFDFSMPTDIEGHRGTDERHYVLNCARLLPPEALSSHTHAVVIPADPARPVVVVDVPLAANCSPVLQGLLGAVQPDEVCTMLVDCGLRAWFRKRPTAPSNPRAAALSPMLAAVGDVVVAIATVSRHLAYQLRPEHVLQAASPLSSDAYSFFGRLDREIHNAEVAKETQKLFSVVIPRFASELDSNAVVIMSADDIRWAAHVRGVPLIHLGAVRAQLPVRCREARAALLCEMIVRSVKAAVRGLLRAAVDTSEAAGCVRDTFVAMFGASPTSAPSVSDGSRGFWSTTAKLHVLAKYGGAGGCLSEDEMAADYDLRWSLPPGGPLTGALFEWLQRAIGVQLVQAWPLPWTVRFVAVVKCLHDDAELIEWIERAVGSPDIAAVHAVVADAFADDAVRVGLSLFRCGCAAAAAAHYTEALRYVEHGLSVVREGGAVLPIDVEAMVNWKQSEWFVALGEPLRAVEPLQRAIALLKPSAHPAAQVACHRLVLLMAAAYTALELLLPWCYDFLWMWQQCPLADSAVRAAVFGGDKPAPLSELQRAGIVDDEAVAELLCPQHNGPSHEAWLRLFEWVSTRAVDGHFRQASPPLPVLVGPPCPPPDSLPAAPSAAVAAAAVRAVGFGSNGCQQLKPGFNHHAVFVPEPLALVPDGECIAAVCAASDLSIAISQTATLYCRGSASGCFVPEVIAIPLPASASPPTRLAVFGESKALGGIVALRDNELFVCPISTRQPQRVVLPTVDGTTAAIASVACGVHHVIVSTADGRLYGWGTNTNGELSPDDVGRTIPPTEPQRLHHLEALQATAIACGEGITLAVAVDGQGVWMIGGPSKQRQLIRVSDGGHGRLVGVACGRSHYLAVSAEGTVFSWGTDNHRGQCGQGFRSSTPIDTPRAIPGLPPVAAVAAGAGHSVAITRGGQLYCWGDGRSGELGIGDAAPHYFPTLVPSITAFGEPVAASCGLAHTIVAVREADPCPNEGPSPPEESLEEPPQPAPISARDTAALCEYITGHLYTFGVQPGASCLYVSPARMFADYFADVRTASCGHAHVAVVARGRQPLPSKADTYCYGSAHAGALGSGIISDTCQQLPGRVVGLLGRAVSDVVCGPYYTAAIAEGTLLTWGGGRSEARSAFNEAWNAGELGQGDVVCRTVPRVVAALQDVVITAVGAGAHHMLAVDSHGKAYAWGLGDYGQLGQGDRLTRPFPAQITALHHLRTTHVAAGGNTSFIVADSGVLYGFGENQFQQVGPQTELGSHVLVPSCVSGMAGKRVIRVAAGHQHVVALVALRESPLRLVDLCMMVVDNASPTLLATNTPKPKLCRELIEQLRAPAELVRRINMSRRKRHSSLAAAVFTWGSCNDGVLGRLDPEIRRCIRNPFNRSCFPPGRVDGLPDSIIDIATRGKHVLALSAEGEVFAWGYGSGGQLGNGTRDSSLVPSMVSGITNAIHVSTGYDLSAVIVADVQQYAERVHKLYGFPEPVDKPFSS